MNTTLMTPIAVLLASLVVSGNLLAQSTAQDGAAPPIRYSPLSSSDATPASSDTQTGDDASQRDYAAALNGTGLISMDHTRTTHILLGSTAATGFDTNPDNLGTTVSTGVYAISPYIGLQSSTPRSQLVLQYQPTITRYTSSAYSSQSINVGSIRLTTNWNQRLSLDGKAYGSYGQDSIRFLGPGQTVAVGGVPGTGPNSAAYLHDAGTGTNIEGALGAHYKVSERDTINLAVADTFSRFQDIHGTNSVATATLSYDHGLTPRLAFITYGQSAYYYGAIHCTGIGGGVGIRWHFQEGSFLSLTGGPQIDSSACKSQQGMSFSASLGTKLTGKSQVYFLAARQPTVSYLGGGLWQTSVSGGYQHQVGVKGTLGFDLSHVSSDALNTTGAYSGTYFDATFSRRLSHGLIPSLSYRGYTGVSGGTDIKRNVVMFSIAWTPEAGHIFQ